MLMWFAIYFGKAEAVNYKYLLSKLLVQYQLSSHGVMAYTISYFQSTQSIYYLNADRRVGYGSWRVLPKALGT